MPLPIILVAILAVGQNPRPSPVGFDPAATLFAEGQQAHANGDLGHATLCLREALSLAPGENGIRILLARTLNERGRGEEALVLLDLEDKQPASAWQAVEEGRALASLNRPEQAISAFRAAIASCETCGPARIELARLLSARGEVALARAVLDPLLLAAPHEPVVVIEAAQLLLAEGRAEEAIARLRSALEQSEGSLEISLALAHLLVERGQGHEAWEVAEALLGQPLDAGAAVQVARIARLVGEPLEALGLLGAALLASPGELVILRELQDLVEDASPLIEQIAGRRIAIDPEDAQGWDELIGGLQQAGRLTEALDRLAGAPQGVRATRPLRLREANILRRLGRHEEARLALINEAEDPDGRVAYERALIEYGAGDFAAAARAFAEAARGELGPDARYNEGLCLRRLARHAEAAAAFEAACAARPSFLAAYYELGREYRHRLGDAQRAREAFRQFLLLGGDDPEIRRFVEEDK